MSLKNQLRNRIAAFDRRSPSTLGEAEAQFGSESGYLAALVSLMADPDGAVSSGSTWLIKAYLEAGGRFSAAQTARALDHLAEVTEWDAQLHICQSVRFLTPTPGQAVLLADWLKPLLSHKRPFLRAWSLDALCRVGAEHSAFHDLASEALTVGLEDGSASVRARARRLGQELEIVSDQ